MMMLSFKAQANTCTSLNNDPLYNELLQQFKKEKLDCQGISSHLTFDDGPNAKTSGVILDELDKRKIKATFFVTTTNLIAGRPGLPEREAILRRQLKNGHTLASHGHEHDAYDLRITNKKEPGFSVVEREQQIKTSMKLLNNATGGQFSKQPYRLFRFPYGRGAIPSQLEIEEMEKSKTMVFKGTTYAEKLKEYRRMSPALSQIADHQFSHIGWNHDSNDSSLPMTMPADDVFKKYVTDNVKALCSPGKKVKVSLFHDIKEVNTRAIPLLVDLGMCLGVKFISPKEMMDHATELADTGVVITNKMIAQSAVKQVDELGQLLKKLDAPKAQCQGAEIKVEEVHAAGGCYSTYLKKNFANCGGETSRCYEGKWYRADDPVILLNCG